MLATLIDIMAREVGEISWMHGGLQVKRQHKPTLIIRNSSLVVKFLFFRGVKRLIIFSKLPPMWCRFLVLSGVSSSVGSTSWSGSSRDWVLTKFQLNFTTDKFHFATKIHYSCQSVLRKALEYIHHQQEFKPRPTGIRNQQDTFRSMIYIILYIYYTYII